MRIKKFKDFIEKIEKNPSINSGKSFFIESQDVTPLASDLIEFFKKNRIEFGDKMPIIEFTKEKQPLSKTPAIFKETGRYEPEINVITIFTDKRSLKDCLRSLAHELIHADQSLIKGMDIEIASFGITRGNKEGEKIEADAYKRGNLLFRKWEETLKGSF